MYLMKTTVYKKWIIILQQIFYVYFQGVYT